MTEYKVVWKIDIIADTPQEAAKEALEIQRDSNSEATVFEVTGEKEDTKIIDLTYGIEYCTLCECNEIDEDSPTIEGLGQVCNNCYNEYIK